MYVSYINSLEVFRTALTFYNDFARKGLNASIGNTLLWVQVDLLTPAI
jgi:hypothetical protein